MKFDLPLIATKISNTPIGSLPQKVPRGIRHMLLEYPVHIIVNTVTACNLACEHCFITNYGVEIPAAHNNIMHWDFFLKILDRISHAVKHAEYFQFSTFEELLHKRIFDPKSAHSATSSSRRSLRTIYALYRRLRTHVQRADEVWSVNRAVYHFE